MDTLEAVRNAKVNIEDCLRDIEGEMRKLREIHAEGISFKIFMEEDEYPDDFDSEKVERAYIWLNVDQEDQVLGVASKMEI